MRNHNCECAKKCAISKISKCPGHIAAKEQKKRLAKEQKKKKDRVYASQGRENSKMLQSVNTVKSGINYINGMFIGEKGAFKYPNLQERIQANLKQWQDAPPQKVIQDYTPYNGKMEDCHYKLLEKGFILVQAALKPGFAIRTTPKMAEKKMELPKECPSINNLHLFECPLCNDGPASHHADCTHGMKPWYDRADLKQAQEHRADMKMALYYYSERQELYNYHFSLASAPEKHYKAPGETLCECQKNWFGPEPYKKLPPVPLFDDGDKENMNPLAQGGVKSATLKAIALKEKEVAERRAATSLLIKRDQEKANQEHILNFAVYVIASLQVGKTFSLRVLWNEKKSSNKNRGDFTSEEHFLKMFRQLALLVPESVKIIDSMTGLFVKQLAPINLGALRKALGL